MSLPQFVGAVLVLVFAGLCLTYLAGVLTYGVSLELGYPPLESKGYTALLGALVSAAITLAACALVGGLLAARERQGKSRAFLPRDSVVVVAVAVALFVLWWPIAAVIGVVTATAFYGIGLAVGRRRASTSSTLQPHA